MPSLFRTASDRRFAATVSRLVSCNPFMATRLELEREALGEDFVEEAAEWNLDPFRTTRNRNMAALLERVTTLVEARVGAFRDNAGAPAEREHFADLVLFRLYHEAIPALDRAIEQAHDEGVGQRRHSAYREFRDAYLHSLGEAAPVSPAHLYACFFQVRRAFFHIFRFFVGTSAAATALRARLWQSIFTHDLKRYQRSLYHRLAHIPTLITGPSGSGKEVVARAIGLSRYVPFNEAERVFAEDFTRVFHPVNLSALSPTLIESELFGHRRGAFTGALQDREGYFAACGEHGTVFLDEIGEADLGIQVKLLRVLQTREFQRLGDVRSEAFHGKVVAATNRDLPREMRAGRFREDFYFRLRADVIETASLASLLEGQAGELEFLAGHVATGLAGAAEAEALQADFMAWAKAHPGYPWPGNFRELEQAMRSVLVHGGYTPPPVLEDGAAGLPGRLAATGWTLKELLTEYVSELYRRTPNYEELARQLEVDRRTVKRYVRA